MWGSQSATTAFQAAGPAGKLVRRQDCPPHKKLASFFFGSVMAAFDAVLMFFGFLSANLDSGYALNMIRIIQ